MLHDALGRPAEKLRISVTDRCNFRCTYCMPEAGLNWQDKAQLLSYEEILSLAQILTELGVRQIRLTGGEPLLRRDLVSLVARLQALPKLEKLSITTNGTLLPSLGPALYAAGLRAYNVSLDSLNPQRFGQVVRRDALDQVMAGLETLSRWPDCEIKLNVVVMRGVNEHEALDFARLARQHNWTIRFIEFMPLGQDDEWSQQLVVPGEELRQQIAASYPLRALEQAGKNPASRWTFADTERGEMGFINSVTEPFCHSCNRIRLTSDGQLRTCLFSLQETDLKTPLRRGAEAPELEALIRQAIWNKEPGHLINQADFQRPARTMSRIGG